MMKRLLMLSSGLIIILALVLAASTGDKPEISRIPEADQFGVAPPGLMKAACQLTKFNSPPTYYLSWLALGDIVIEYFDPAACGVDPTYPFEITSFSFTLYTWTTVQWPVTLDVVVYDLAVAGDDCGGPGQELCRTSITCSQPEFEYPNIGTVYFPTPCCVNGPFYIGLEYNGPSIGPFPSVLFDGDVPDTCDIWVYYTPTPGWFEAFDLFTGAPPGDLLCYVNGETGSANCGEPCTWAPGDPFKMHFPQLPDETGWAVNATQPLVLADDFRCEQTGWIKDVHWWGAWKNGVQGQIVEFVLSLHADIPAEQSPTGYSMPGATLWEIEVFGVQGTPHDPPTLEGWYDPAQGLYIPDDHQPYFQYDYCLPEEYWFWQDSGRVYWLNISAIVADPTTTQWGWKSTDDHWNDDAVYAFWGSLNWQELFEPSEACDTLGNAFYVEMFPDGSFGGGGGENAYGNGWYYYPMYDWWNIWFYDHKFTYDNYKAGLFEFDAFRLDPQLPAFLEIAVNWSTDRWSLDFPQDSMPPLPGVPEELYIGRQTLFMSEMFEGHYLFEYVLPDYNPEWISVDVRGYNFVIPAGVVLHACCPKHGPSLDLAFVITGEPPQPEMGACCYNPTGGPMTDCIVTTAADCQNLGGVYHGDGTSCTGSQACCLPGGACINADPLCCINELGGTPQGPGTSCTTLEACCMPDGSCQMMDPICCDDMGGVPQGPGSQCTALEACCMQDGTCQMLDPICCDDQGGVPQGPGTACTALEACCMPDGDCIMLDPVCCDDQGGVRQGPGTACTAVVACCFQDGSCQMLDPLCCDDQGGQPSPIGAPACLGDNNQNGTDDACEEETCDCLPGDANGNLAYNILDVTYLISYLYKGGAAPTPYPLCSGDANCNCAVNILDVTYLITYLYKSGPAPCSCQQWLINCGPPLRK
ncbi:MAG: dockerin type I repeat-containing protein [Candidatus Zixiibacteriota bacterium]